jgi:integrase/recombinase XerD
MLETLMDHVQRFLGFLEQEKGYSSNTIAAYRNDLSQFAEFLAERGLPWHAVTKPVIIDYILHMKGEQEYASSTVARKVAAVKSFFHHLVDHGELKDDPTATLDSPKVRKRPPRTISQASIEQLLEEPAKDASPKGLRDRALLEFLYATGLRVTEVVCLNVDDVNLVTGHVRVVRGKDQHERLVPVAPRALQPLETYLASGRVQFLQDAQEKALFLNHRGHRLTRQGLWLIVKRYVHQVGIDEDVTPQTLRHTFAVHQLDSKADLEYIQTLLGHANLSTTQVYTQVAEEHLSPEEGEEIHDSDSSA